MRSTIILIALLSIICFGCEPALSVEQESETVSPNAEVIALYEEIIAEQEVVMNQMKAYMEEGLRTPGEVGLARAACAETRIELAQRLGQHDKVVNELELIVPALERAVEESRLKEDLGMGDNLEGIRVRHKLLHAKIRLIEARDRAK